MSKDLFNMLLNAAAAGEKIEISVEPRVFSEEEAIERLWNQKLQYTYEGKSGTAFASATFVFDFENLTWEKAYMNLNLMSTGAIPREAAEKFIRAIAFIVNLPETIYCTNSERIVPADPEEGYAIQSSTKRLTGCRVSVDDKILQWVAETDTEEPYGPLYHALETLRQECGLTE